MLEFLSKNEGKWRAGIKSTLVGGEQELNSKWRIQREAAARETLKGDTRKTFRGSRMQTARPRAGGDCGVQWVSSERGRRKLASWLFAAPGSRVTANTPCVSEAIV